MLYRSTLHSNYKVEEMNVLLDYINHNYMTLLILAAFIIMTVTNKKHRLKGTRLLYVMAFLTFLISVAEYVEIWVDTYNMNYRILFYKTTLIYWLYPLLIMLLLYITEGMKHKYLITIPLIINMAITAIDLSGKCIVYSFGEDHGYVSGPLSKLPEWVEVFYVLLLVVHSIRYLWNRKWSKGIIIFFMAGVVILSQIMVGICMPNTYMPAVAALEILTYYFYLSAIQYNETQDELVRNTIQLERNKCNLLLAQIRPHFINSNLAVIRSLCYEDTEKAVEMIDHFSAYLRENIQQMDDMRLVPFTKEMESIDNYLYLEMQRFQGRIDIEKDLEFEDFAVPPLSVQTIVENAVRHGISMTGVKGTIWISTGKSDDEVVITVRDDGKGFDTETVDFDGVNHVGIKNVKDRFQRILHGNVEVISKVGEGTTVIFHIPNRTGTE